jgi:LacI family sucrose operon transcriptional repressor
VDGILLSAINITDEHREIIRNSPVPLVVLAQDYDDGICVVYDDYGAGKAMGTWVGRGHPDRVGYMGVDESDEAVGITRKKGVLEGLKACGVECIREISGDYSYESGIRMAQELLDQGPLDAVICATDRLAFGAYRVLEGRGLRIPEDVSVAGFGGYDESTLLKPELTTLKFDSYGLGYLGAETLIKMIREEPVPKKQIVGYQMIEGESVGK